MKQVTLKFGTGELALKDVAPPLLRSGHVLVAPRVSLISTGTERAKLMTARQSLLGKARSRPDQVRQILKKLKEVGVGDTLQLVQARLTRDEPLGYSLAGEVIAVGRGVESLRPGDRVACAGAGYANHAEIVVVPKNLCAAIPDEVSFDDAAFVTLGAIALQAVRQAEVGIGEHALVVGLGLLGQLTVQLLRGICGTVVGSDISADLCARARENGAFGAALPGEALERLTANATAGRGFDVAIVTAADLSGSAFETAIAALRDRGRVVVVGGIGMHIHNSIKSALYERELDVRFARSYGPGRYDDQYEEGGRDYPYGYVRWTEQRNLSAVLGLMAAKKLTPHSLVNHHVDIEAATDAFELLAPKDGPPPLAVLLHYRATLADRMATPKLAVRATRSSDVGRVGVGIIGAGNFAQSNLLPHLKNARGVDLVSITTASGISGPAIADRFGIRSVAPGVDEILRNDAIDAVLIASRHDSHADLVCQALAAGKDVFVEKPLALDWAELEAVTEALASSGKSLMVGFNRRFSRAAALMATHMRDVGSMTMNYRVNAGPLAPDSWYASARQGGRFVGEAGHFIDFMAFLAGTRVMTVRCAAPRESGKSAQSQDTVVVSLKFEDGSVGTLSYVSSGSLHFNKEYLEVFGGGRVAALHDFRLLELTDTGRRRLNLRDGKGHREEVEAWVRFLREGGAPPVDMIDQLQTTAATLAAVESLAIDSDVVLD